MNSRQRLVFYILLNIFISALVTGTILFFYSRIYQKDCTSTMPVATPGIPSSDEIKVAIVGINGAGVLASEAVIIQNNGISPLMLTDWTLKNNLGSIYTFPQLMLFPGGMVQLHTRSGSDTAADLYWQRSASVWSSGELAALYDSQNIARAFYRVP
jgi:Lamin Tail Domain